MLSPSLKRMINKAQSVECMNNIKVIGTAYLGYSEDNSGFIPISANHHPFDYFHWMVETSPYLGIEMKDKNTFVVEGTIYNCPHHDYRENNLPVNFGGYGLNWKYAGFTARSKGSMQRKKFLDMNKPNETILMGDTQDFKGLVNQSVILPLAYLYTAEFHGWSGQVPASIRHELTYNKLWGDLHVSNDYWDDIAKGRNNDIEYFYKLQK